MDSIFNIVKADLDSFPDRILLDSGGRVWRNSDVSPRLELLCRSFDRTDGFACYYYGDDAGDFMAVMLFSLFQNRSFVVCPPENVFLTKMQQDTDPIIFVSGSADSARLKAIYPGARVAELNNLRPSHYLAAAGEKSFPRSSFIVYTSGSTGDPVGVMLDESSFLINTEEVSAELGLTADDKIVVCNSFYTSFGFALCLLLPLLLGKTVYAISFTHPAVMVGRLLSLRPTCVFSNPSFFKSLLTYEPDLDILKENGLRMILSSGAPLPESCFTTFFGQYGIAVADSYGATETNAIALKWNSFDSYFRKLPSVDIRSALTDDPDSFALFVQTRKNMLGYIDGSEVRSGKMDGRWVRTGDFIGKHGGTSFHITGRESSLIKIRGNRVQAELVEKYLEQLDDVEEACVYSNKDVLNEDILCALIVLSGKIDFDPNMIITKLSVHLPAYMIPRRYNVVPGLQKNNGKKIRTNFTNSNVATY